MRKSSVVQMMGNAAAQHPSILDILLKILGKQGIIPPVVDEAEAFSDEVYINLTSCRKGGDEDDHMIAQHLTSDNSTER